MSGRGPLSFRPDEDLAERIENYTDRYNFENRGKALEHLVEAGLQQHSTPLLDDWQDHAIQSAHYLMVAAVVAVVFGMAGVVTIDTGVVIGGILILTGVSLLSVVELARTAAGVGRLQAVFGRGGGTP